MVIVTNVDTEADLIKEVEMPKERSLKREKKSSNEYLMESEEETIRLEVKTDPEALRKQAIWCGVKPGMRVLDAGCGPGITTAILHEMVQPGGSIVGIDYSRERINYAKEHYGNKSGIEFRIQDFRQPMDELGQFDLVWVRFVLEYYRKEALQIVNNLKKAVKPGGFLCLLDLDYNCLSHYELSPEMEKILPKIMKNMDDKYNFDTYIGRKLYSLLYDTGFENIEIDLMPHNLFYGDIKEKDLYNLSKKIEIAAQKAKKIINSYPGGQNKFANDLKKYFNDQKSFSYTPLLLCKGVRSFMS